MHTRNRHNTHNRQRTTPTTHSRQTQHWHHTLFHSNEILKVVWVRQTCLDLKDGERRPLKGKYQGKLWWKLQAMASVSGQAIVVGGGLAGMSLKGGGEEARTRQVVVRKQWSRCGVVAGQVQSGSFSGCSALTVV